MNNLRSKNRIGIERAEKPHVLAVASGKGGVGKSVIAFNLAHYLSLTNRVLLIDSDFQMGNLHLLANVAPKHGWQEVCLGCLGLTEAVNSINANLNLLASVGGRLSELVPDLRSLTSRLSDLKDQAGDYDFIIVDTASGILPHTSLILNTADEVILVTTPELTSLSDCYALYKILITNNKRLNASLLVNREDNREDVEYIYQKFVTITGQFLIILPRSSVFWGMIQSWLIR